jgi:hypothetical protein
VRSGSSCTDAASSRPITTYPAPLDQVRRSHRGGAKASRYSSAETRARPRDSALSVGRAPATTNVIPNNAVPPVAHHNRIRAAPPCRRASPPSDAAATVSTRKKEPMMNQRTACGSGRSTSRTGTELTSQTPQAVPSTHAGTRRN